MTWPRDTFARAVWRSNLRPLERLVALAYADHAADQDVAWVTYPELLACTGLASNGAVTSAVDGLRQAGWLTLVEPARGRRAARYQLCIPPPAGGQELSRAPVRGAQTSSSPPARGGQAFRSPPPDAASPPSRGDDHQSENPEDRSISAGNRAAIDALLTKHSDIERDVAERAVAGMWSWSERKRDPIHNIVAFAKSRSRDEILSFAAAATAGRSSQPPVEPCRDERCVDGWLGDSPEEREDRPVRCPTCRPHSVKAPTAARAPDSQVRSA